MTKLVALVFMAAPGSVATASRAMPAPLTS